MQIQCKKQLEIANEKEKQVRKLHELYITKLEKHKEMEQKINERKK
jgi:hypothetical protein